MLVTRSRSACDGVASWAKHGVATIANPITDAMFDIIAETFAAGGAQTRSAIQLQEALAMGQDFQKAVSAAQDVCEDGHARPT